jgi:hypothetical protein
MRVLVGTFSQPSADPFLICPLPIRCDENKGKLALWILPVLILHVMWRVL